MDLDDYTPGYNKPADKLFCVMSPDCYGPAPSFWPDMKTVVSLLARHCGRRCGATISVWQRRTATSQWKLISDTSPL